MKANPLIFQTILGCIIKPWYIKKISCVGRTMTDDYWLAKYIVAKYNSTMKHI